MPHKHKRRQRDDSNNYDLPPSTVAKPLPARPDDVSLIKSSQGSTKVRGRKRNHPDEFKDDTPRAFAHMMRRLQKSPNGTITGVQIPPGLDDGLTPKKSSRRRKRGEHEITDTRPNNYRTHAASIPTTQTPKILPGESLSDFAARVDLSLPLLGISKKSNLSSNLGGKSDRRTKHERQLLRMQHQWREEEVRIREREDAEREEMEVANEEVDDRWKAWELESGRKRKKSSGKKMKNQRKTGLGEDGDHSECSSDNDPWAEINSKARATQSGNPFEVVQAPPPQLMKARERFKVHGMRGAKVDVADVPTASGSLRRREELAGERQNIVEAYRQIMAEKRG